MYEWLYVPPGTICSTFENLCRELEEQVEEVSKAHVINSQLHMSIGGSAQKLCFEYEHFMFHQKMTADRIAFFLGGFSRIVPATSSNYGNQ